MRIRVAPLARRECLAPDWVVTLLAAALAMSLTGLAQDSRDSTNQNRTMINTKDGQPYVWIPPGAFTMGCSEGDTECDDNEKPPHPERIANGFWLSQTEVTQAAYQRVTGRNPSPRKGDQLPVESLTWDDAENYCTIIGGRLPTEAEWEFAARAGTTKARYGDLDAVAWHSDNSDRMTHRVASKEPNAFGLYDMLGNVWEYVADSQPGSSTKILRGGSMAMELGNTRASRRYVVGADESAGGRGLRCAIGGLPNGPTGNQVTSHAGPAPGVPDRIYNVGNGVSQPSVIAHAPPEYSEVAGKLNAVGTVNLQLVVDVDGKAKGIKVIRSFGYGLDEKAIEAVRKWQFKPGMKDGNAVPVYTTVEMNFERFAGGRRKDSWYSGPLTFPSEAGVSPPVVQDGSMPGFTRELSDESAVLEFTVDPAGSVKNIHPVNGSESASSLLTGHLRKWRFQPALKDGRPVEVTGRIVFFKGQGGKTVSLPLTPSSPQNNPPEPAPTPQPAGPGQPQTLANPSLASADGSLGKLSEKDLYLQTNSQTVLRFRLLAKTLFHNQQGAQIRDSLLRPGDHLSVQVNPDDPETAVQVVLLSNGTTAERQSAEQPVKEDSVRAPESKDLEKPRAVSTPGDNDQRPAAIQELADQPWDAIRKTVEKQWAEISPPKVIRKTDPAYSKEASIAQISGPVTLLLVVDVNGRAKEIKVVKGKGLGFGLDERAIDCVRKWEFTPAKKNGQPVPAYVTIEVKFRPV